MCLGLGEEEDRRWDWTMRCWSTSVTCTLSQNSTSPSSLQKEANVTQNLVHAGSPTTQTVPPVALVHQRTLERREGTAVPPGLGTSDQPGCNPF